MPFAFYCMYVDIEINALTNLTALINLISISSYI